MMGRIGERENGFNGRTRVLPRSLWTDMDESEGREEEGSLRGRARRGSIYEDDPRCPQPSEALPRGILDCM